MEAILVKRKKCDKGEMTGLWLKGRKLISLTKLEVL